MITSKNGRITVLQDDEARYLLGPIRKPKEVTRYTMYQAHLARCTRSAADARAWADRMEAKQ